MTRDYTLFVKDILDAIKAVQKFVGTCTYKDFIKDEKTRSAVVWKIQVIGEATKNIPKAIRDDYENLLWKYMAKIRDKIAHFYFGIDYKIVWQVAKEKLPEIKPAIERMLRELKAKKKASESNKPSASLIQSGAERDRTVDLLNAIQALSQLSYSPNVL